MPDSPAERLVSLNQQAIAILRLKIPLDFGFGAGTEEQLREINDRLMIEMGSNLSADALLQKHQLPERYQAIARMLLASDDPAPIFQSISVQELDRERATYPLRQAIAEPLVVAGLVYLGLILLCTYTIPQIEAQYAQQGQSPTGVTFWLIQLRDAMPIWIVAFPIIMIGAWVVWRRYSKDWLLRLFPGNKPYSRWLAAESQARRLACLVGSGVDEETALSLASTSVTPRIPIRPIAENIVRDGDAPSKPRALNRLARFYHFLAEDRRRTYFSKAPALVGLFVAGLVVLGYGLATFLPWIEILTNLSGLGDV